MNKKIRTRIAPSPTGLFHFGTARTALYSYLFAKKNGGEFVLRIEDTDKERSKKEYEEDIIDGLKWLGLSWDGEISRQSDRSYVEYIDKLFDLGIAFWCEHTQEELEEEKKMQIEKKEAPRHVCDHFGNKDIQDRKKGIVRLRPKKEKIVFNDLIRGEIEFDTELMGDISIARKEGKYPLYNLCVVVDDHEMDVSHVIRGEDHISNTPKQIAIYRAFGWDLPEFAHLPLILNPDKSKMSKRHNIVSLTAYKEDGYLPEAIVNFMALLGWNPGSEREEFSLSDLEKEFSLERVHKGGAVFDIKRLDWLNGVYIRKMNLEDLTKKCIPYLEKDGLIGESGDDFVVNATNEKVSFEYIEKVVALEQERIKKISEIGKFTKFFFVDVPEYEENLLVWKKISLDQAKQNLKFVFDILNGIEKFNKEELEKHLMPAAKERGVGDLLWPLRVSLSGEKASPGPFEIMSVLGKERSLKRIKKAME